MKQNLCGEEEGEKTEILTPYLYLGFPDVLRHVLAALVD